MAESDAKLWCIRSGRFGELHKLFLEKKLIVIGWPDTGDLSKVPPSREEFKKVIAESYPEYSAGKLNTTSGQLFRFVNEMKVGDYVVYPTPAIIDSRIYIGRVTGEYTYDPRVNETFPHLRSVEWIKDLDRISFSQGALYEIGAMLTLFQIRNYADEFLSALHGKRPSVPADVDEDETVLAVSENIEQNTRDFIIKKLSKELKGHPLAYFVAHLLGVMGYHTRVSPPGPDGGVDIIAHRDELGFEPPIIKVQVKSSGGNVGEPDVSALYGQLSKDEYGLFITLGGFTHQAVSFARSRCNLRLVDGDDFVDLILSHYDLLDVRYRGILPLKRVYVPEPIEDTE